MKLTDTTCKKAKPKEKPYKLADGGGLYLLVKENGAKHWRLKYRFLGKEKLLAVGVYPIISLAEAREAREKAKKLLAGDPPRDPMAHRAESKSLAIRNVQNTFQAVALEWQETQQGRWSKGYAVKVMRRLEMHLFPSIGHRPINQITPPELLECLRKVEKSGALDMAGRAKEVAGQVFRYGIQTGKCERDAAADLRGALKAGKTEHFRSMELKELPGFIKALERNEARIFERTRRAIWLSLLTFCRPGEIRQAQWSEIDFDSATWTIPGRKMKMGKDHIIPLSRQALSVLKEQRRETEVLNTDYVFPSQIKPKNCMSDGTVNRAIERLGFGETMVAHGVRALARTTIREKLGYDSEIIEKQLAHRTKNPLGEAYDRTQFLDQRRKMMQHWANYLDAAASGGMVVAGNFRKRG